MINNKKIKTKISIGLLAKVILASMLIMMFGLLPLGGNVDHVAKKTLEQQKVDQQMQEGEALLIHMLQEKAQNLKKTAQLIATDTDLAHALLAQDEVELQTQLNQRTHLQHTDAVYFMRADNHQVTGANKLEPAEINALETRLMNNETGQLQFLTLQQTPYLIVALNVQSPVHGWMVLGSKLDQNLVSQYQSLSDLEISLVQKSEGNHWQIVGSTLRSKIRNQLVNVISKTHTKNFRLKTMVYDGSEYQINSRTLYQDHDNALVAVIHHPVTATYNLYSEIKWWLIALAVLLIGIVTSAMGYVSKNITKPLKDIIENTREIAKGNYHKKIRTTMTGELASLGQNINEMREAIALREEKVHALAYEDALTELANRLGFMKALNEAIQKHEKSQSTLAVLILNIDRFKQINTTFGRDFGDEVLRHVANLVVELLPAKQALLARLDADEFAVMLRNTDQEEATQFASALKKLFEQPVQVNAQHIDLRMGIGIALYPMHGNTEESLLHQAEIAQQMAKQKKTAWIVYNSALEIDHTDKLRMMTELKEAIKNQQLVMYLQPKVNTKTRALVGAEALIRWVHPRQGMLLPEAFIPFVEHTPTMTQITYWMIEEACRVMLAFKQQLIPLNISVNISTRDLNNIDLPNQIQKRMEAHGLSPKVLRLEITENALMNDPISAASVVRKLSELGIHISIDNFGSGYSSLSFLRELPVKELKIDQSFIKEMHRNAGDKAIVRSTIDLGHHLGLKVVAKGIESEETIEQLATLGCDEGQGYYISKPMPVRDFGIWLERWNNQISQMEYELALEINGSPLDCFTTSIRPTLEPNLEMAPELETV